MFPVTYSCVVLCVVEHPPSPNQPARFNRNVVSVSVYAYSNHAYYMRV